MLKQIKLMKEKELRSAEHEKVTARMDEIEKRFTELVDAVDECETDDDLAVIGDEEEKLTKEKNDLEKKKAEIEDRIDEIDKELEALNEKAEKATEDKRANSKEENMEIREQLNHYIRTKGQVREGEGFKLVDGGAIVPKEILEPVIAKTEALDLKKYVDVRQVNTSTGTEPFIEKTDAMMHTVEELEKNPELAKPKMRDINFKIDTYRGFIAVSQEAIDDTKYDLAGLIAKHINRLALNTTNAKIAGVLKTAKAKAVTGVDGLKTVVNKDLSTIYNTMFIMSASLFDEIDRAKDSTGRYLLSSGITEEGAKRLFAKKVVVLDDKIIGNKDGDMVAFVGDPEAFMTYYDRKQVSVKWVDNDVYGEKLAGFIRFDAKKTDEAAGFYVTYTPAGGKAV